MKLSQLNQLLRSIKAQYGDIDITVNGEHRNGLLIRDIEVKETPIGNIASINFYPSRLHKVIATGTVLKTNTFSHQPIIISNY